MHEHSAQNEVEHIRLLSIFHWVLAVATALFALFPIVHLIIGITILNGNFPNSDHDPVPRVLGWFFVVFALCWIVAGLVLAFCLALSAMFLSHHKNRTFCLVVAGASCLFFPFGTVLGVFTIIVLTKPEARALFERGAPQTTPIT